MTKRVAYIILLVIAVTFNLSTATAQVVRGQDPLFKSGEEITLTVSYRAKMFPNTEMARVTIKTETSTFKDKDAFKVTGSARVVPSFRWF